MSDEQAVDQIEFRWQPVRDMSAVAWSFEDSVQADGWSTRLAGAVRPATPDRLQGVPEASFFYHSPGDQYAGLIWRHFDLRAEALADDGARRPLVARAIVGPAAVLTPELAMTLCRAAPLTRSGPRPGQVSAMQRLPRLPAADLAAQAADTAVELDESACREPGLARLIAAALRRGATPLGVLLPGREMVASPKDSAQLLLLWGLWRTVSSLVAPSGEQSPPGRGWSFSTYEPPLGDTDPAELPAIVFRSQEQQRQPVNMREEVVVQPRRPEPDAGDMHSELAEELVLAYRDRGGEGLERLIRQIAAHTAEVGERLDLLSQALAGGAGFALTSFQPQAGGVASSHPYGDPLPLESDCGDSPPSAPDATEPGELISSHGTGRLQEYSQASDRAVGQQQEQPMSPPRRSQPTKHALSPDQAPSLELAAGHASPPGPGDGAPARRHGPREQLPLADVLDWLREGPGHADFTRARTWLSRPAPAPSAADRARARKQMPGHNWYVPGLVRAHPFMAERTLQDLFAVTVVPDIERPAVAAEVAGWAEDSAAEVVRALCAAAYSKDPGAAWLLKKSLQPVLSERWLLEHGIHFAVPENPLAEKSRPVTRSRGRADRLLFFRRSRHAGLISSVLAWVCLGLIVFLVIVIS
jgi:hypothetical protein